MRVVVDTNILVSTLLSADSVPGQLIAQWRAGRFTVLSCSQQLDELMRVTRYPKSRERLQPALAGRLINELRGVAQLMDGLVVTPVSPIPNDDYLLALALAGQADVLVTGDKRDLLSLGHHGRTRIMAASSFLTTYRS